MKDAYSQAVLCYVKQQACDHVAAFVLFVTNPADAHLLTCSALLLPLTIVDLMTCFMFVVGAADAIVWLYTARDWPTKHF